MFLFRRQKTDVVDEIDGLDAQNQILIERYHSIRKPHNHIFIFFLLISISLAIRYKLDKWMLWTVTLSLGVLVLIVKALKLRYIRKRIEANTQLIEKGREKMDNDKEIEEFRSFMNNFIKNSSINSPRRVYVNRSIPVKIFDFITHSYVYNPKAIICKKCGANNGLCDDPSTVKFFCMNCGCNEKGEEFDLVTEEEEKIEPKVLSFDEKEGKIE